MHCLHLYTLQKSAVRQISKNKLLNCQLMFLSYAKLKNKTVNKSLCCNKMLRVKLCYAKINLPLGAMLSWSVWGWLPCQLLLDRPCAPPGTQRCPQSPEQMPSTVDSLPRGSLRPHGSLPGRVLVLLESIRATQHNAVESPAPVYGVVEWKKVLVEERSLEKNTRDILLHACVLTLSARSGLALMLHR